MVILMDKEQFKKLLALDLTNAFINLKASVISQDQSSYAHKDHPTDPDDFVIWEEVFEIYEQSLGYSESISNGVIPKI